VARQLVLLSSSTWPCSLKASPSRTSRIYGNRCGEHLSTMGGKASGCMPSQQSILRCGICSGRSKTNPCTTCWAAARWVESRAVRISVLRPRPRAVLCSAVQCSALLCSAVRCCAVLCVAVLCVAVRCCAVLCGAVRCCAVRCCAVLCGAVLCGAVRCCPSFCPSVFSQ
jgi:hypothetical protein